LKWLAAAGDGRDEHDLIALLEAIRLAAQEADVLVIDVDVDEAAQLSGLVLDLGGEGRKVLVDIGDERREIGGVRGELLLPVGVADEGGREDDLDGDDGTPWCLFCCGVRDASGVTLLLRKEAAKEQGVGLKG
jgi:hypothetical protein